MQSPTAKLAHRTMGGRPAREVSEPDPNQRHRFPRYIGGPESIGLLVREEQAVISDDRASDGRRWIPDDCNDRP